MRKTLLILSAWALFLQAPASLSATPSFSMEGTGIVTTALSNYAGDYFCVLNLFQNAPARHAGVKIGDRIVSVNGKSAEAFGGTLALDKALNPPAGNTVRLQVERMGRIVEDPRKSLDFELQSQVLDLGLMNIPDLGFPLVRVLSPGALHAYGTTLRSSDPVRQGDQFFVFRQGRCLGTGSIWAEGESFYFRFNHPPGSSDVSSLEGTQLVFHRPGNQSFHASQTTQRTWPEPPPQPRPDPLYVSYSQRSDLESLLGQVLSHDPKGRVLALKVVKDVRSAPLSGPPPPGGGHYAMVTTRYEHLTVHYPSRVDAIPKDAPDRIERDDYVGVYFKKKGDEIHALMIHLLSPKDRP